MSTTTNALNVTQAGLVSYDGAGNFTAGSSASATPPVYNLGMTYSGGTFSVTSADGTALSASNKGYVTLQSGTAGELVTIEVTANQTFTDGSGGSIAGQRFGITNNVDWGEEMPFSLYAGLNDAGTAVNFFVGRSPSYLTLPAASRIGKTGATVNSGQQDLFALGNPTVADYDLNTCLWIGSFTMTYTGSTNHWDVNTLLGIGVWKDSAWVMPVGQNGAQAGNYFQGSGAPAWTSPQVQYYLQRSGLCTLSYHFLNTTTAGTSGFLSYVRPLSPAVGSVAVGSSTVSNHSGVYYNLLTYGQNSALAGAWYRSGTSTIVNNADFGIGDDLYVSQTYLAFTSS